MDQYNSSLEDPHSSLEDPLQMHIDALQLEQTILLVGQCCNTNLIPEKKGRSQQCDWECSGLQHAKGERTVSKNKGGFMTYLVTCTH